MSEQKKKLLIDIVDKIISIGVPKTEDQKKIVENHENHIDEILMELYGLSSEEIALINRSFE
jgi:DNA-binding MarR family transcriptional regulator